MEPNFLSLQNQGVTHSGEHPFNANHHQTAATRPLHELFDQDQLLPSKHPLSSPVEDQKVESQVEPVKPSFWSWISSWWSKPTQEPQPLVPMPEGKVLHEKYLKQTQEIMSLMSESTIDEILGILHQAQLELEKENAIIAKKAVVNHEKAEQLKDKILEEVEEALKKDEKLAGYSKWISGGSFAVSLAGLTLLSGGALSPFTAGAQLVSVLSGTFGAYYQYRGNQDKAHYAELSHERQKHQSRMNEGTEWLTLIFERDSKIKERWIRAIKRQNSMMRIVLNK
jgi:hypothetical protein